MKNKIVKPSTWRNVYSSYKNANWWDLQHVLFFFLTFSNRSCRKVSYVLSFLQKRTLRYCTIGHKHYYNKTKTRNKSENALIGYSSCWCAYIRKEYTPVYWIESSRTQNIHSKDSALYVFVIASHNHTKQVKIFYLWLLFCSRSLRWGYTSVISRECLFHTAF